MPNPVRFFLYAIGLAALSGLAGAGYASHLQGQVESAKLKCESESARMKAEMDSKQSDGPWKGFEFKGLVCDPQSLQQSSWEQQGKVPPGAQGELLTAYEAERSNPANLFYILSAVIVFVGILPAIWYFLLARLGEIADAVRRK